MTTQCSIAPGEHTDDTVHHAVPYLRCSEHASISMHRSSLAEQQKAPPRCPKTQQHVVNPNSPRDPMCHDMTGRRVPGTQLSDIMPGRHFSLAFMSDMCQSDCVSREMSDIEIGFQLYWTMPGMEDNPRFSMSDMQPMHLSSCICTKSFAGHLPRAWTTLSSSTCVSADG